MGVVKAFAVGLRYLFALSPFFFFKFTDIKQALEVKGNTQVEWLEPQEQKYATSIPNSQHMEGFEETETSNLTT